MLNFLCLFVLCLMPTQTTDFVSYAEAHKQFQKDQSPIIVIVTSDSCSWCVKQKTELLSLKKDFPDIVLCEVQMREAVATFRFIKSKSVPQIFMYARDNESGKIIRFNLLVGFNTKAQIYKAWAME